MATRIWQGGAQQIPQLNTITPGAANSQTYTITINGKSANYLSDASATVAEITAGLVAAANLLAQTEPEFESVTWADTGTTVTATGPADGTPFTQTSSATGGGTLVTVVTTAASGPNHWSTAANWSGGAVPVNADDVIFDANSVIDCLYGLAQSGVTLTSLTITAGYTGRIGLPERNEDGFDEYRPTYLAVSATTLTIGQGEGPGSDRLKIDTGANATTVTVFTTSTPFDAGYEAFLWKGTHATNLLTVVSGSVGIGLVAGDTEQLNFLRVGNGGDAVAAPKVRAGVGLTLATLIQTGGEVELNNTVTTITKTDGTLTVRGTVSATTVNNDGGVTFWDATGTITTLNNSTGADFDRRRDPRGLTITNCNMYADSAFYDDFATVTFTNPFTLVRCNIDDLRALNLGNNRTYQVAGG